MKNSKYLGYSILGLLILTSCQSNSPAEEATSNLIEITEKQFVTDQMQVGIVEEKVFDNLVKCNGYVVPLPEGKATLSVPISGVVKSIAVQNGQMVRSGQLIFEIEGNELIDIQREYAEVAVTYKRLKSEYDRVNSLYTQDVIAEKDFRLVENEYFSSLAMYKGLKMKIERIHLSADRIENGDFYASYPVHSPLGGTITNLNVNLGSFVTSGLVMAEVIDTRRMQIQLSVFNNDSKKIEKGQTVRIKDAGMQEFQRAVIHSVGIDVKDDTKTVSCYATLTDPMVSRLIVNQYLECEIVTSADTVSAIPTEAILRSESGSFVLKVDKKEGGIYLLTKAEVTTGRQYNGYTELLSGAPSSEILTRGVYNIVL